MGAGKRRRQRKRYASQIVTSPLVGSAYSAGLREGSTAVAFPPPHTYFYQIIRDLAGGGCLGGNRSENACRLAVLWLPALICV